MWRILIVGFMLIMVSMVYSENQNLPQFESRTTLRDQVTDKFDLIVDEDISDNDPRLKSIIYSAKSYKNSQVSISYYNPNAVTLATHLGSIIAGHGVTVLKPTILVNSQYESDSHYVFVTIIIPSRIIY